MYSGFKRTSVVSTGTVDPETGEIDPTQGVSVSKIAVAKPKSEAPLMRKMLQNINPEKD
jgi:putative sterol carrier protein